MVICLNILGCGISSLLTTRIGRKRALLVVDTLFCVSLIGAFPNYKEHGKGVLSFAMGIAATATPLYVSEATPRRYAFMSMFIFDVSVTFGGSLNYVIVLFFERNGAFIFGFCLILLHLILVFYLKETIPFLLKQGKMSQAREDAKIFFEKEDVEQEIKTMLSQISSDAAKGFSLMSNVLVRRMLAMCTFLHILARLVGSSYISRKKSKIINSAGLSRVAEYSFTITTTTLGFLFSVFLVEPIPRKLLIVYSLAVLSLVLIGLEVTNIFETYLNINLSGSKYLLVEIYTLVFPPTLGSVPSVIVTEFMPFNLRTHSLAICSSLTFLTKAAVIIWLAGSSEVKSYLVFVLCSLIGQLGFKFLFKRMEDQRRLEASGGDRDRLTA